VQDENIQEEKESKEKFSDELPVVVMAIKHMCTHHMVDIL